MERAVQPVGEILRQWRRRRRLSQLDLATEAGISQRHLSFLESGRSAPSRDMVLRLAEELGIPLRERNALFLAAGYAPIYRERRFDDPALTVARQAIERLLVGHEPYPALAIDRHWTLVTANAGVSHLLANVASSLLEPPVNVLRLSLHPDGLAPRIANFREWRAHVLSRLAGQIDVSADRVLVGLLEELKGYPNPPGASPYRHSPKDEVSGIAVPLRLVTDDGVLSFLSTTTVFGTPVDIALSELAIESFFPADRDTAAAMMHLSGRHDGR